jgi:REP element-mobilizing transposase RayT
MNQTCYLHKRHNVSVLLYHFVCPAKYRRVVFDESVDQTLKQVCQEIQKRYEIRFLEIGTDKDHVHFLIQSTPKLSPTKIITTIKSITAKEVFRLQPQVKKILWGGQFWSDGYYVSTVGQIGNVDTIANYVKNQGQQKQYKQLYNQPLGLFDTLNLGITSDTSPLAAG